MDVIYDCCCGIDVHQKELTACLITTHGKKVKKQLKTFSTMTSSLFQLTDWLTKSNCTHIAMESTGVYWKPVYNVLEAYGDYEIFLANARMIKNVPGRKTDTKDAVWIAKLLRSGLVEKSFIPPKPIRELRDLVRYRRKLISQISSEKNRIQKVLEDANIKIGSVVSDVFGVSGQAILQRILDGEVITEKVLDDVVKGKLKKKIPELKKAVRGYITKHHIFMIKTSLLHMNYLKELIEKTEYEIDQHLKLYQEEVELLETVPCLKKTSISEVIAEIGVDMTVFPTAQHLSSWACVCPGNNESAGKRKSSKTSPGKTKIKTTLCEVAWAISRSKKDYYLTAKYWRLASRRGKKKAQVAIAHKILVSIYYILKNKESYKELGKDYLNNLRKEKTKNKLVNRLESMGYSVDIDEVVA